MRSKQLASRFREVLLDGKWIANTNFKEVLIDVSYHQAIISTQGLNSLLALTFHINYYIKGLNDFFESSQLTISDKYSFEYSNINNPEKWQSLKSELITNSETFAKHVASFSDEKLAEIFVDEKYGDFEKNINGLIEHSYYHLGQSVLIKKLVLSELQS